MTKPGGNLMKLSPVLSTSFRHFGFLFTAVSWIVPVSQVKKNSSCLRWERKDAVAYVDLSPSGD